MVFRVQRGFAAELFRNRESAKPANTALPQNVAGWLRANCLSLRWSLATDRLLRARSGRLRARRHADFTVSIAIERNVFQEGRRNRPRGNAPGPRKQENKNDAEERKPPRPEGFFFLIEATQD